MKPIMLIENQKAEATYLFILFMR